MTVEADLIALARIKAAQDELTKEKAEVESRLITALSSTGRKTVTADLDGESIKGTYCAPERTSIDADGLEHDLTPKQWEKVSKRVLDKELLEAAVVQNIVGIAVVQKHSETKPTKPYIRVTGKVPDKILLDGVTFSGGVVTVINSQGRTKPAVARKRAAAKRVAKVAKPRTGK